MKHPSPKPAARVDVPELMTRIHDGILGRKSEMSDAGQKTTELFQSVVRSFGLVAQQMEDVQRELSVLGERARRGAQAHRELDGLAGRLREVAEQVDGLAARLAGVEEGGSGEIDRVREAIESRLLELEERCRTEAERGEQALRQTREQVDALASGLAETRDGLNTAAGRAVVAQQEADAAIRTLRESLEAHRATLAAQLEAAGQRMAGAERRVEALAAAGEDRMQQELDGMRIRLLRAERALRASGGALSSSPVAPEPPAVEAPRRPPPSFDYFAFERSFRGTTAEIKRRQSTYVEFFLGRGRVLDLGAGRGEFLELLTERGIPATGVDLNEDMVDFCRDRGLPSVHADVFQYLESLPDESVDGIFAAQLVEHFPPERIMELISVCGDKLRRGGVFIAETVNVGCPVAMGNFFLDPTHVRPVPADLLRFMLEQDAFQVRCLRFSSPVGSLPAVLDVATRVSAEASAYQDYAAIAIRR